MQIALALKTPCENEENFDQNYCYPTVKVSDEHRAADTCRQVGIDLPSGSINLGKQAAGEIS